MPETGVICLVNNVKMTIISNPGKFICCVKVRIKKELAPSEASSQEGAVQEAYTSLLQALSLEQTTTPGTHTHTHANP